MARTTQSNELQPFFQPPIPENEPVEIPLLTETLGMRPAFAAYQRDPRLAVQLLNIHYNTGGRLSTGISTQYSASGFFGTPLSMYVYRHENIRLSIVAATDTIYYRLGVDGSYFAMTGDTFTGLYTGDRFTFTPWGTKIICTNPVVGMYEIDPDTKTYTKITAAPQDVQFITVHNGRLIASGLVSQPRRVQWSVKFDNSDWSGLGSGFEDLQPTNVQSQNYPLVVQPVNDTEALLFREDSCMLMSATDRFDTPFLFSELHRDLPCGAPFSIANTRHGVVMVSLGDLYIVTKDSAQVIGPGLITKTIQGLTDSTYTALVPRNTWLGKYHAGYDEYWMLTPTRLFRFQFEYSAWVEFGIPDGSNIADISMAGGPFYLAYASLGTLGATYADLPGVLGDDASISRADISVVTTGGSDFSFSADLTGTHSGQSSYGFVIITADIDLALRNRQVNITCLEIEYELFGSGQVLTVAYSLDNGATWTTYGTITTVGVYSGPRRAVLDKVVTGQQVRFKITGSPDYRVFFSSIILRGVVAQKETSFVSS